VWPAPIGTHPALRLLSLMLVGAFASVAQAQPARPTARPARPTAQPARPAARPTPAPPNKATKKPLPAPPRRTEPLRPSSTPPPARPATPNVRPADPYAGLDQTGTPSLPPRTDRLPPPSAAPGTKRPLPNYRGAANPRATAGEVLIWIPRVLLFPVHITLEYLIRWPLVKLITVLEKHHVLEHVGNFFKFDNGKATWLPTFIKEFGKFNQAGLYYAHKNLGVRGHSISLQGAFWVNSWYHVRATDEWKIFQRDQGTFKTRVEFQWRPDKTYYGLGPDTLQEMKSFYRLRQTEVEFSLAATLKDLNRFSAGLVFRNVYLSETETESDGDAHVSIDDPRREQYWDVTDPTDLPGYKDEYNLLRLQLRLDLDSRNPERVDTPGSGVRLELRGAFSFDPSQTNLHFVTWASELAGFLDVTGRNHVLSLRLYVAGLERTGSALVPFHERLMLGGKEYLRGYFSGRFRGDSAVVASAQYQYPIWWMLDAYLFVSVGNAFGDHFHDFRFRKLVMSWGVGIRTNASKSVSFDILVAFGSNQLGQWAQQFELDDVRLIFGINQGF
jgi:Omp85 superfamily domain